MAKQIKIGFDKGSTRSVETDQVLRDIRGNLLRDEAGNFLYTKTDIELPGFLSSRKAASIVINNDTGVNVLPGGPVSIREQFPETSTVSSSLLGVPRRNVQQSLLADVSVYGLDENLWEFYRNPSPYAPREWIDRFNERYGARFYPRLSEKPDQQALAIEAFPTPWTFPFGPEFADQSNRYNSTLFALYARFVRLGNDLYRYYTVNVDAKAFADKYFLPEADQGGATVGAGDTDVIYGDDFEAAMAAIERWTLTWMDIRDGRLQDPRETIEAPLRTLSFPRVSQLLGEEYTQSNTRPGYRSDTYYYAQLQSKEAFRYQPGAISGFTFGVKINFNEASLNNKIEWGCANETDQYMFQVAGSRFNIVRRSTVPFTAETQLQNNLNISPQVPTVSPNPFERPGAESLGGQSNPLNDLPRFETVIDQDSFNGDSLDGTGPSGYNISFQEVTMYKIEFSWYGAIGAKFYAYIPVGHGECRWVLLHTLIIENTLPAPALRNPFLHFRYSMVLSETNSLREPIYIYKYGASYYIDGADEGTYTFDTYTSPTREIVSNKSTPILGFQSKESILNSVGQATPNQKNFFIDRVTASTTKNSRIDVLECEGCKNGFGHYYSTSLINGTRATPVSLVLTNGSIVTYADGETEFSLSDTGKKIIAPGIFSTYIVPDVENLTRANILRRVGASSTNNNPVVSNYSSSASALINGVVTSLNTSSGYGFTGRLFGFDDVAASTVPIYKDNINIRFLNPISRETTGHYREFRIGVTSKVPSLDEDNNLVFDGEPINLDNEVYGEFSHYQALKNVNGTETTEHDPRIGSVFEDDYRIPRPKGAFSGECSTVSIRVENNEKEVTYTSTNPETTESGNYLIFADDPNISVIGGEIGVKDADGNRYIPATSGGVNITFISNVTTYVNPVTSTTTIFAEISAPLTSIPGGTIAFKILSLTGRHVSKQAVQRFDVFPLYLFVAMHDEARVHNIVVQEFDSAGSLSHTPVWLIGNESNIQAVEVGNPTPDSGIIDVIGTNEYLGRDGLFYMGGVSTQGNPPANFTDSFYLNGTFYDSQLNQPLRPGSLKYTFFLGANETTDADMTHVFGIDRYKVTKGSFNNKSVYINSRVLDSGETGSININILGKEQ